MPKKKLNKRIIVKNDNKMRFIAVTVSIVLVLFVTQYLIKTANTSITDTKSEIALPKPTAFPTRPQPEITGWKSYSNGTFSFDYPEFLPEPTTYWHGDSRQVTSYKWKVEKFSSGNYDHYIDLTIEGPFEDSTDVEITNWLKDQNWPYQEGENQEMAGKADISYRIIQGQRVVQSVFSETNSKNARSWTLYFNSKKGVYRVALHVQGTEEELSKYQSIFAHLFSTFKFVK